MDTCTCSACSADQYFLNPDDQLYERRGLLNYKPVSLADRQRLEPYIQAQHFENSELTFTDIYIWRLSWHVEWAIYGGALYFRMRMPGKCQLYPVMPLDGNLTRDMIDVAIADMRKSGLKPIMGSVSEEYLARLKAVMPEGVSAEENIDFEDYVYRAENLRELAGKRYHGKRNHVARFMRDYAGRFTYRPLRACDREACLALWDKWYAERVGIMDNAQLLDAAQEREMIADVFGSMNQLNMRGGVVEMDGEMAAFTLCEREGDMMYVRLEKGLDKYEGIYAYINQMFAREGFDGINWINREEDMGIPGLRRSKQSYYPDHMVKKYMVDFDDVKGGAQ